MPCDRTQTSYTNTPNNNITNITPKTPRTPRIPVTSSAAFRRESEDALTWAMNSPTRVINSPMNTSSRNSRCTPLAPRFNYEEMMHISTTSCPLTMKELAEKEMLNQEDQSRQQKIKILEDNLRELEEAVKIQKMILKEERKMKKIQKQLKALKEEQRRCEEKKALKSLSTRNQ